MTKKELKTAIKEDLKPFGQRNPLIRLWLFFIRDIFYYRSAFCKAHRELEFLSSNGKTKGVLYFFLKRKKNRISNMFGWEIPLFTCGAGLHLWHANVIINENARIGKNALFHGNNCVGRKNEHTNECPRIGNNCEFGFGSFVGGKIVIADSTIIGANSVVIHSCNTPNQTLVGSPAKPIDQPSTSEERSNTISR